MHAAVRSDGRFEFGLPDPDRRYSSVRLDAGLGTAGARPELVWSDGLWSTTVELPPLHRVEYGFEVIATAPDPSGSGRPSTGTGERAVLELPDYQPPPWLARDVANGVTRELRARARGVTATLWSAPGLDERTPAPLLVVHDGPDYVSRGRLTQYLSVLAHEGSGPPVRALLLSARPRDVLSAIAAEYAHDLVTELIPGVRGRRPTTGVVAVGASLGALAALHAQWLHPGMFDAMLLQSGSFFTPETDAQESWFSRFGLITDFVAELHTDARAGALPPIALTYGSHEENAPNNKLLWERLRDCGVTVSRTELADLHNFTCWRDGLDPSLRELLAAVT